MPDKMHKNTQNDPTCTPPEPPRTPAYASQMGSPTAPTASHSPHQVPNQAHNSPPHRTLNHDQNEQNRDRGDDDREKIANDHRSPLVVGITGASGAAYALRLIELFLKADCQVHLVVSDYGKRLLADELGVRSLQFEALFAHLLAPGFVPVGLRPSESPDEAQRFANRHTQLLIHPNKDVGAVIASGSFLHAGMVILPCTSTTLGSIASGAGSNLLCRAAAVSLKERRPLILCHREMPLSLIDIENMARLTQAGATICPTNPGFYLEPKSIEDIVDFIVGKVLDLLHITHTLAIRWEAQPRKNAVR